MPKLNGILFSNNQQVRQWCEINFHDPGRSVKNTSTMTEKHSPLPHSFGLSLLLLFLV